MEGEKEVPIPRRYRDLLNKFPSIMKPDFNLTKVKHGVVHTIETGSNKPVTTKVRPLMPGTEKRNRLKRTGESWKL